MLLIFDLDDTLVNTWGCCIELKLKLALETMISAGLDVVDKEESLKRLLEINRKSTNAREALQKFLSEIGGLQYLDVGVKANYGPAEMPVKTLLGAVEVLKELKNGNILTLVSHGVEEEQLRKMKSAGISKELFSEIIITNNYDKQEEYQKLLKRFSYSPSQAIVCGDKFKTDLLPAKRLGIKTVHMAWGRGKIFPPKREEVDYMIKSLKELLLIVENLVCKQ